MSFDDEAKTWDDDPVKVERAEIFANEILDYFKNEQFNNGLEFGCGTGLLSFDLANKFKSIILIDTSENMVEVLREKIKNQQIKHFKPMFADILTTNLPENSFDAIYTLLTLHHIIDLEEILNKFKWLLKPGGFLCIADLVKEDGSFHTNVPGFDGHDGFDRNELTNLLLSNCFEVKHYKIFYEIEKTFENGTIRNYPLFLMFAQN